MGLAFEVEQDAAVGERVLGKRAKVLGEHRAEVGLGDAGEDGVAPTNEPAEHHIGGRDPFEDEDGGGERGAEFGDLREGHLIVQQEVVDNGEHEDGVEGTFAAVEKASALAVTQAGGGGGIGEIGDEREDALAATGETAAEGIDGVLVGVNCDDLSTGGRGDF